MPKREIELIRAVKGGDRDSLSELVRLYFDRMERHGRRICGNREDAEEVLQETFTVAIDSISDIRGESGFSNWLYKVASSICTKKRRRRREESGHALDEFVIPDGDLPDDLIESAQLRGLLADGLKGLSAPLRDAVTLVYFKGYSGKEAAGLLGIEEEALRTRLHRGRAELRRAMADLKK